jgi:hypothetical protein
MGPRAGSDGVEKRKSVPVLGFKLQFPGCPTCTLVTKWTHDINVGHKPQILKQKQMNAYSNTH